MAIDWTPARLEVDLNYKSKDIVLASEWNNLWKETRLQGNNNTDGIVLLIEIVEGNVTHLTNLDKLLADLESKVTAHTGNSDIHVTSTQKTAWTAKYDKPSGGIPKSDLASSVQSSLDKADTALQQHQDISALTAHVANNNIHVTADQKNMWFAKYNKPTDGIPKTDLASGVQTSLNKADTALQEHQDISDLRNHVDNSGVHVTTDDKIAWNAKYDKPTSGIPKIDLASSVQTSLGKADSALQEHQDISALTNHVANNDIHLTTANKTAWNAKAEVFTFTFSYDENGQPVLDTPYEEIVDAYNNGKLLRPSTEIFEGYLLIYNQGSFVFVFPGNSLLLNIASTGATVEAAYMYLPYTDASDTGKILMVNSYGEAAWTKAPSSGSSGAEVFLVTFTQVSGTNSFTADKTYSEIVAAHEAGKIVLCTAQGILFGRLVNFVSAINTVWFRMESYTDANSNGGLVVVTINSANEVNYRTIQHYSSSFSQYTVLTSGWSSGVYSFESDFPSATYDIEIELDSTATESQVEAWSSAKPTAVFGTNTMKALGDVPTVDIPVIVKKVMK